MRDPASFRQWLLLVAGSAATILAMFRLGLPGAWLLGPMVAGIAVGVNGGSIRVPSRLLLGSQAILGCMVAGLITRAVLASFARQWPVFLAVTLSTILAGAGLGWVMSRRGWLPGTTAIWGMAPGAATAMTLMAEEHGGDPRLVATMQYLRVLSVAAMASLIARFWIGDGGTISPDRASFPPLHPLRLAETLAIAGLGMALANRWKIPSGSLLVPLVGGSILNASGAVVIEVPRWLLAATFAAMGWGIGLRFTRDALVHAARSLPMILAAIAALMGFCGVVALVLHQVAGTDLLTAYLATSPGGIDSAAVIAASAKVDLPFIMGLQTLRAVVVMFVGPSLARIVARRLDQPAPAPA